MTTPNYLLCDICGDKIPTTKRRFIVTDRVCDSAGDMDDEGFNLDICKDCELLMKKYIDDLYEDNIVSKYEIGRVIEKWVGEQNERRTL